MSILETVEKRFVIDVKKLCETARLGHVIPQVSKPLRHIELNRDVIKSLS